MSKKFKSQDQVLALASTIKSRRLSYGFTLKETEEMTDIDCSQISRFEAGKFRAPSKNLQKLCKFLKIEISFESPLELDLGARLERFVGRSPKLKNAVEDLLLALESLEREDPPH